MARAAAVSRQTVSNVLNGSGRVGDAARARVLAAVEALGYHPHHGARSLRSRRTRQVAYVTPHLQLLPGNYLMQQFLQSLAAACARRNNSLVVVVPEGDPRDAPPPVKWPEGWQIQPDVIVQGPTYDVPAHPANDVIERSTSRPPPARTSSSW